MFRYILGFLGGFLCVLSFANAQEESSATSQPSSQPVVASLAELPTSVPVLLDTVVEEKSETLDETPAIEPIDTVKEESNTSNDDRKQYQGQLLTANIRLDGRLDEEAWQYTESRDDFVQKYPVAGEIPSLRTTFQVLYDPKALYIGIYCEQKTKPRTRTLRRDNFNIFNDDSVTVKIDPYLDRRTTLYFTTNAAGAEFDRIVLDNGRDGTVAFDALWEVSTQIHETGWSAEYRIPFTALGISGGTGERRFGFDIRRDVSGQNETYQWVSIPQGVNDDTASFYGDLSGIDTIEGGQPIFITPYLLASSSSNGGAETRQGLDLKTNLGTIGSVQLSLRTDFAQVSPDAAFVNLGRFAVALPEQRPFFLEGTEIFSFGSSRQNQLFFSRRIGIEDDISGASLVVPMDVGLKTQGRSGPYSFGFLNVLTGPSAGLEPGTTIDRANYTVARIRREFGDTSNSGLLLSYKQVLPGEGVLGRNDLSLGWDGTTRLLDDRLQANTFFAYTRGSDRQQGFDENLQQDEGFSTGANLRYSGEFTRYDLGVSFISPTYDPKVGFVRRTNIATLQNNLVFVPRPEKKDASLAAIPFGVDNSINFDSTFSTILDANMGGFFNFEWKSGANVGSGGGFGYELIDQDFSPLPDIVIPAGEYLGGGVSVFAGTPSTKDLQVNGNIFTNYSARQPSEAFANTLDALQQNFGFRVGLRANLGSHITSTLSIRDNILRVTLTEPGFAPEVSQANIFTANGSISFAINTVLSMDTTFQVSDILNINALSFQEENSLQNARFFGSGLVQARLNWRYRPGSDLFVIYAANRPFSTGLEETTLTEHSLIIKLALTLQIAG